MSIFEVAISALVSIDCSNFVCNEHLATDISRRDLEALQIFIRGHSVLLWSLLISKIYRDMRPPAKLSYRSAFHKKVVFGAGDAWTLPQIQGEVGGDQEPPGDTWRHPKDPKFFKA